MGRPGPMPDARSVNRNDKAEWDDVDDVPFDHQAAGRGLSTERTWHPDTVRWWLVAASMPHACRWRDADWLALYDLALLKQKFYQGVATGGEVTEMRRREDDLGMTREARMKNRIRYVPPKDGSGNAAAPQTAETGDNPSAAANVTPIASARDRLRRGA